MTVGLNVDQIRELVIRPTLAVVDIVVTPEAEETLLAIAAHESAGFRYVAQIHGPALGLWQMEPATHDDCWEHFIDKRPGLIKRVRVLCTDPGHDASEMAWNLRYACAMARLQLRRFPEALPAPHDLDAIAALWKLRWNTPAGAGTIAQFVANYHNHVGGPPV